MCAFFDHMLGVMHSYQSARSHFGGPCWECVPVYGKVE